MDRVVKRGYVPTDEAQFGKKVIPMLRKAKEEVAYLLERGYKVKPVTTFVGNHYMLSERQRLALSRIICSKEEKTLRNRKALTRNELIGRIVHVDGFNTIITLEVALSQSLLLLCDDGSVRDLAGVRGTYRIIDKTAVAIRFILEALVMARVEKIIFYLDQPVSNSGKLRQLIEQLADAYDTEVEVQVRCDVDSLLETKECVISSDAFILSRCKSFYPLTRDIIESSIKEAWILQI